MASKPSRLGSNAKDHYLTAQNSNLEIVEERRFIKEIRSYRQVPFGGGWGHSGESSCSIKVLHGIWGVQMHSEWRGL